MKTVLDAFLDEKGRVKAWPSKRNRSAAQGMAMELLAAKFVADRTYTEKEVNAVLNEWHTFEDHALLRRELIIRQFLGRTKDGSQYWKNTSA